MRHKKLMPDAESDELMLKHHPQMRDCYTIEQLGEALLETVQQMTPDEKAHFRARLSRRTGLIKSSEGKPS